MPGTKRELGQILWDTFWVLKAHFWVDKFSKFSKGTKYDPKWIIVGQNLTTWTTFSKTHYKKIWRVHKSSTRAKQKLKNLRNSIATKSSCYGINSVSILVPNELDLVPDLGFGCWVSSWVGCWQNFWFLFGSCSSFQNFFRFLCSKLILKVA